MTTSNVEEATRSPQRAQIGGLRLPMLGVPLTRVPVPAVRLPGGKTTGRLLWWGGLAMAAAAGVVDWPVAALVAVGSWVGEQFAKADTHPAG
jgi:hypothetical protein